MPRLPSYRPPRRRHWSQAPRMGSCAQCTQQRRPRCAAGHRANAQQTCFRRCRQWQNACAKSTRPRSSPPWLRWEPGWAARQSSTTAPTRMAAQAPPPSLPYKVDTSRPSLHTNWTRLVHRRRREWPRRRCRPLLREPRVLGGRRGCGIEPAEGTPRPSRRVPASPHCRAAPRARAGLPPPPPPPWY